MWKLLLILISLLPVAADLIAACAISSADRQLMHDAQRDWAAVKEKDLRRKTTVAPRVIAFDRVCFWSFDADAGMSEGTEHEGRIPLPDGEFMEPALTIFTSTAGVPLRPYLVIALPSIWRESRPTGSDVDGLIRSVFVHEMTHTEQSSLADRTIERLQRDGTIADSVNDDVIQNQFRDDRVVADAVAFEIRMLFDAVHGGDAADVRRALLLAANSMMSRRDEWESGRPGLAEAEDLFLTMEGVANWAAVRAAIRRGTSIVPAVDLVRGSRRYWSQELGLAVFLAVDAMGYDWRTDVFGDHPPSIPQMMRRAAGKSEGPRRETACDDEG